MPSIKAVLFDLDDTLWPVGPVIARAEVHMFDWLREHAPEVARRFSIEALRARRMEMLAAEPRFRYDMVGLRSAGLREAFLHCNEDCARVEDAMAVFGRSRNTVDLFDDVHTVLSSLAADFTLGTISNGPADLELIGLAHHFEASVAAWRFGRGKPDPEIFLAACQALNVAPEQAAYVGDDPLLDVEGAQKAGMTGIWLDREGRRESGFLPEHLSPDAICANLYEVEHWLRSTSGMGSRSSLE